MRDEFNKKKAAEEAARNDEIKVPSLAVCGPLRNQLKSLCLCISQKILAEEAAKKNRETVSDAMVKEAQERVAREAQNFGSFTFQ